jgi:hypothetical protein
MSASASRPLRQPEKRGRLWWLPARGEGNGLDDDGWAAIADIPAYIAGRLLADLHDAGVPAYVAAVTGRRQWRLWVGYSGYGIAEDFLRVRLPQLMPAANPTPTRPAPVKTPRSGKRRGRRRRRATGSG